VCHHLVRGFVRTIGNVIWFILGGIWTALGWLLVAAVLAITVIGIPFARQCLKLAHLTLWPFGRTTVHDPAAKVPSPIGNVFWVILAGWWLALGYVVAGALCCLTIIGIPFGLQSFKLAGLSFAPFGRRLVETHDLAPRNAAG
jgi:uncharacterized membrane protein YccF (DUF307 family)